MLFKDLRQAIGADLNRDDLADVIDDYIADRIAYYQTDFFWSSPQKFNQVTTAGQALYAIPTLMVGIDVMRMLYGDVWRVLEEDEIRNLLYADVNQPSTQSLPTRWAPFGTQFRLYPVPDDTYTLELTGPSKIAAPTEDDDTNFWTTNAAALIRYATTAQIRALRLRDPEGAQIDLAAAERERFKLVQETTQKESSDRITAWW